MNKELQFKTFTSENINSEAINELNNIFNKGKIYFSKEEICFCYFSNKPIVITNDKIFTLFIDNKKEFDFIQIPLCRVLKTFCNYKGAVGMPYIVFDCSIEKREMLISLDPLIEDNTLTRIKDLLEKNDKPFNINENIIYKHIDLNDENNNFTTYDADMFINEKMRKKIGFFSNSRYIRKISSTHKEWFTKTIRERIEEKKEVTTINIGQEKKSNLFMGVDIDELIAKHTCDGIFLKNGCAKKLVELTGIDIDDAKEILESAFAPMVDDEETTSIKASFDLNSYEPVSYTSPTINNTVSNSKTEKPLSKKQRIKQNKKNGIVCCPKCGSTSITTTNKKLSVKRGLVGLAINPLAGAVGAVTSKKIYNVCMNCGHRWKP